MTSRKDRLWQQMVELRRVSPRTRPGTLASTMSSQKGVRVSAGPVLSSGRSVRMLVSLAIVLVCAGCWTVHPESRSPVPVQDVAWFEGMRIEGSRIEGGQHWDTWMGQPWMSDAGDSISFYVHRFGGDPEPNVVDEATVRSCEQLFDADHRGLQPPTQLEDAQYAALRRQCYAARIISQGVAAETSFLADFSMDERAFRELPAELVTIMSPGQQAERVDEILRDGGSLAEAIEYTLEGPTVDASDVDRLKQVAFIVHDGWHQDWTWLARGDFNHDGIEDLLVSSRLRAPVSEAFDDYRLFLLTRRAADSSTELLQEIPLYAGEEADACSGLVARCGREIIR